MADLPKPTDIGALYENYLGGATPDAWSAPGGATRDQLTGGPRTRIVMSQGDPLGPSGEAFAESLRAADVDVEAVNETHRGHHTRPAERAARRSIDRIAAAVRSMDTPRTRRTEPR